MTSGWKRLSEQVLYQGTFRRLDEQIYQMPNGHTGRFEVEVFPDSTCVTALLPDGRLIAQRQYRVGQGKMLLQMPGGIVDPGEDPLESAKRELEEETGYTGDLVHLASTPLESFSSGTRHFYLATNCQPTGRPLKLEPEEDLETVFCTWQEYLDAMKEGDVNLGNIPGLFLAMEKLGKIGQNL